MGYINGTAGLFVMGIWPWLGLAETLASRWLRAAAISAAALIASTAVLTQSRAIVLATVVDDRARADRRTGAHAPRRQPADRARRGRGDGTLDAAGLQLDRPVAVCSTPSGSAIQGAGLALLGAALVGFALKWLVSALARSPAERTTRERLTRQLGRALLAVTAVVVIAGAVAEHGRISDAVARLHGAQVRAVGRQPLPRARWRLPLRPLADRRGRVRGRSARRRRRRELRRPVLPAPPPARGRDRPTQPRDADARRARDRRRDRAAAVPGAGARGRAHAAADHARRRAIRRSRSPRSACSPPGWRPPASTGSTTSRDWPAWRCSPRPCWWCPPDARRRLMLGRRRAGCRSAASRRAQMTLVATLGAAGTGRREPRTSVCGDALQRLRARARVQAPGAGAADS